MTLILSESSMIRKYILTKLKITIWLLGVAFFSATSQAQPNALHGMLQGNTYITHDGRFSMKVPQGTIQIEDRDPSGVRFDLTPPMIVFKQKAFEVKIYRKINHTFDQIAHSLINMYTTKNRPGVNHPATLYSMKKIRLNQRMAYRYILNDAIQYQQHREGDWSPFAPLVTKDIPMMWYGYLTDYGDYVVETSGYYTGLCDNVQELKQFRSIPYNVLVNQIPWHICNKLAASVKKERV